MRRLHWFWLTLLALALLTTACGGGSGGGEDADTIVDDTPIDAPADDAELDATAALARALDASSTDSYRVEVFQGMTLQVRGIGLDQQSEIDPERPASISIVDGDHTWLRMDLSATLGELAVSEDLWFDIWTDPDRMVIDTSSYAVIERINPSADLGPFRSGVAVVDLTAVARTDEDFVAAIAGNGTISLEEVTERIIGSVRGLEVSDDGRTFVGFVAWADLLEMFGGSVEDGARSAAAGLAQVTGVDIDGLTAIYVDVYRRTDAEIEIRLDEASLLSEIRTSADLAHLYDRLGEALPDLMGQSPTPAERAEVAAVFSGAVFTVDQLMRLELDPAEAIPDPPAEPEDRTAEWVDWLDAAGF